MVSIVKDWWSLFGIVHCKIQTAIARYTIYSASLLKNYKEWTILTCSKIIEGGDGPLPVPVSLVVGRSGSNVSISCSLPVSYNSSHTVQFEVNGQEVSQDLLRYTANSTVVLDLMAVNRTWNDTHITCSTDNMVIQEYQLLVGGRADSIIYD